MNILARTASFESGLSRIERRLSGFGKSIGRVSGLLGGLAGGIGIGAVVKRAIDLGDSLDRAATKAGISGRAMSELAHAANMSDVSLDGLSTGLRNMQRVLSEAASGSKSANESLTALGLTARQLQGLSADRQLERIAEQVSRLKDPADRTRAALEVFGKAGADLLPLFEQGAAGIRKMREEAKQLGLSFSDDQLKALAAADDSIKRLTSSFSAMATTLVAKVAPGLSTFFDNITAIATGDKIGKLREQIDFLERMKGRSFVAADYGDIGTGFFTAEEGAAKLAELQQRLRVLTNRSVGRRGGGRGLGGGETPPPGFADTSLLEQEARGWAKFYEDLDRQQTGAYEHLANAQRDAAEEQGEFLGGWSQVFNQHMDELSRDTRDTFDEWSVFADEAARNMQGAFADFLFDPFEGGLDGMFKSFANTLRRMVAEAAAAKIFESIFGAFGGLGGGGGFGGFLGKLFGFAEGGSFRVGGTGGPDSQPVAFRASPSEVVTVSKAGQRGGGDVYITNNNNVDARGATTDLVRALPAILGRNNDYMEARIRDLITRGRI